MEKARGCPRNQKMLPHWLIRVLNGSKHAESYADIRVLFSSWVIKIVSYAEKLLKLEKTPTGEHLGRTWYGTSR